MANEISTYTYEGTELPFEDWSDKIHSFNDLASIVQTTHDAAQSSAIKAINRMQTMRNWLIGYYIIEFEQHGKDSELLIVFCLFCHNGVFQRQVALSQMSCSLLSLILHEGYLLAFYQTFLHHSLRIFLYGLLYPLV